MFPSSEPLLRKDTRFRVSYLRDTFYNAPQ
jgi:hypothetical protein